MIQLPFSRAEFFAVFASYNESVWPAQVALYALAVGAVVLAMRRRRRASRLTHAILAALWLWMGVVYQAGFLSGITRAGFVFAVMFVIEGVLFARLAIRRRTVVFAVRNDTAGWAGSALIVLALVLYPAMAVLAGHRYPAQPTFGLPCPTTIFTLGILLWGTRAMRHAFVIPVAWALIGSVAALRLGVQEDFSLLFSLFVVLAATAARHRSRMSGEATASELVGELKSA